MSLVPQRVSLVSQVTDFVRREILRGQWKQCLPGHRWLCDSLQVSRTTLDQALRQLEREGLVKVSQGRRTRILRRKSTGPRPGASRIIVALTPGPLRSDDPCAVFDFMKLQQHLQDAGFRLEMHFDAQLTSQRPGKRLESLVSEKRAACWILTSMSPAVQEWFVTHRQPALVLGFAHEGIRLPSFEVDLQAVCRHAAGTFLRAGHRRIGFLATRNNWAGDLAGEKGFREAFQSIPYPGASHRIIHHDGTNEGIRNVLRSILDENERPTGLLVSHPLSVLTTVGHLIQDGIRIPADVAVISRDHEEFLRNMVPSIASYEFDPELRARRLSHLVVKLAQTGHLPARPVRIMADFRPGDSFGPPRG